VLQLAIIFTLYSTLCVETQGKIDPMTNISVSA